MAQTATIEKPVDAGASSPIVEPLLKALSGVSEWNGSVKKLRTVLSMHADRPLASAPHVFMRLVNRAVKSTKGLSIAETFVENGRQHYKIVNENALDIDGAPVALTVKRPVGRPRKTIPLDVVKPVAQVKAEKTPKAVKPMNVDLTELLRKEEAKVAKMRPMVSGMQRSLAEAESNVCTIKKLIDNLQK